MRILQPVTDRKESMALFEALRVQAFSGAVAFPNRHVGFRGGGYDCSVYWRPDEGIWGVFENYSHTKRFWICWGVRHPLDSCVITVETNPPVEGFNRRCSGAFLRDGEGAVYLGHSGRVGGGRKVARPYVACSRSRSRRRRIFPDGDLGIASMMSSWRICL